jgi:hypothetical protein
MDALEMVQTANTPDSVYITKEEYNELRERVETLELAAMQNITSMSDIKKDTTELLETFKALKGAWTVLNWVGKLAPVVVVLSGAATAVHYAIKNWVK